MKAAQYNEYGSPEVIKIQEADKPVPGKKQVLIKVVAAAINPFDYKVRRGYMKDTMPLKFPVTIGGNLSGVIVEVGEGVSEFKIGDEVYGQSYGFGGTSGAIAEYATANSGGISLKPKNITYIEAASMPLVGVSAIQALEQHMRLQKGQKILIHGGAGGIGSIAIQVAKNIGAYVAATVSSKDIEFVKELGADEVIDYTKEKFEDKLSDLDGVYDTVGGDTTDRSFKVLKKGQVLVSMMGESKKELAKEYGVIVIGQNTNTNTENLQRLKELIELGVVKPEIDRVFPLEKTSEAFGYVETGHPRGKVVIEIKDQ